MNNVWDLTTSVHETRHYISDIDVLTLSCTIRRLRTDIATSWYRNLYDRDVIQHVTNEDVQLSTDIRKYYSNKLTILSLKGQNCSKFRKDLANFLLTDGKKYAESEIGMLVKLPEFYHYDTTLDYYKNSSFGTLENGYSNRISDTFYIQPVVKLFRRTKNSVTNHYWFSVTSQYNHPLCIVLDHKNPLLHMWDNKFDSMKVLKIKGTYLLNNSVGFNFYLTKNWQLED